MNDVFPIENRDFPISCLFSGVYIFLPQIPSPLTQLFWKLRPVHFKLASKDLKYPLESRPEVQAVKSFGVFEVKICENARNI